MRFELTTSDNTCYEAKPEDTELIATHIFSEDYHAIITEPHPQSLIKTVYFSLWRKDNLGIPAEVTNAHITDDMESGTIVLENVWSNEQENIQVVFSR